MTIRSIKKIQKVQYMHERADNSPILSGTPLIAFDSTVLCSFKVGFFVHEYLMYTFDKAGDLVFYTLDEIRSIKLIDDRLCINYDHGVLIANGHARQVARRLCTAFDRYQRKKKEAEERAERLKREGERTYGSGGTQVAYEDTSTNNPKSKMSATAAFALIILVLCLTIFVFMLLPDSM